MFDIKRVAAVTISAAMVASAMALPALATEDTSSEASATTAQVGATKVAELAESVASAGLVAVKLNVCESSLLT